MPIAELFLVEEKSEEKPKNKGFNLWGAQIAVETETPEISEDPENEAAKAAGRRGEFFNSEPQGYVYINPAHHHNVLTWTMCRNIIRVYGRSFMLRGEAYLSVDLMASLICLAAINVLIVGGVEHYIWDSVILLIFIFHYAYMVIETSLSVADLNDLVTEHREILRLAKVNILGTSGIAADDKSIQFLSAIDELIETREQEADPHKIFGFPANRTIVQTYLGIIGSGLFFAAQTFITSDATYDSSGKFVPGVAQ